MNAELRRAVIDQFGTDADEAITILLAGAAEPFGQDPDRVMHAIFVLGQGDLELLRHYAQRAQDDVRDVLYWAEYPPDEEQAKRNAEQYQEWRRQRGLHGPVNPASRDQGGENPAVHNGGIPPTS